MTERRTLEDGRAWLLDRLARRAHPLDAIEPLGDPKSARVFDGGHMGEGPVVPTILDWVSERLAG